MAIILITVIAGKKEERLWYRAMRHYNDKYRKRPAPPLSPKEAARKQLIDCVKNNGVFDEMLWEPDFGLDLEFILPGNMPDHQEGCGELVPSKVFHDVMSPPVLTVGTLIMHA
jgi:hypothetical protein